LLGSQVSVAVHGRPESGGGLGIVLERSFLASLDAVPGLGEQLVSSTMTWNRVTVRSRGDEVSAGGHQIHGVDRGRLLALLRTAVEQAGVPIHTEPCTATPDLVVGADGVGSPTRTAAIRSFGTWVHRASTWHAWTSARGGDVKPGFVFLETRAGCLVAHTYPFEQDRVTMVVEAMPQTIRELGLAGRSPAQLADRLTTLFRDETGGAEFDPVGRGFEPFNSVTNRNWFSGNTVLAGDAAHTTHFSIGSGTMLAIDDGETLAQALASAPTLPGALKSYQEQRSGLIESMQSDAAASQEWFATAGRHVRQDVRLLMFALRSRRDFTSYGSLRQRDPEFIRGVMAAMTNASAGPDHPSQLPLRLRDGTVLPGRLVVTAGDHRLPPGVTGLATGHGQPLIAVLVRHGTQPGVVRGLPVGLMVEPAEPDPPPGRWDFLVTTLTPDLPRVLASARAAQWRHETGAAVGIVGSGVPRDEIETLIASGRIDFAVVNGKREAE
jgi:anthraniloyl-CoA monooxygenase